MSSSLSSSQTPAGAGALPALGAIRVAGADAGAFLNAQLSNDIMRLGDDRSLLAAWCDAKGRALALPRIWRSGDGFILQLPADLVDPTLERLRLFVLRAKVELTDAGDAQRAFGVIGDDNAESLAALTDVPATIDGVHHGGGLTVVRLPGATPRLQVHGHAQALAPLRERLATTADFDALWRLAEIRAGLPAVQPATRGAFVPQMLNLHWLAGLDFNKGCYPGQEVIARLHYRGTLKRRLYRASVAKPDGLAPGDAITGADSAHEGTVIVAAPAERGQELLAVIRRDAADDALTVAGQPLTVLDLPYATG